MAYRQFPKTYEANAGRKPPTSASVRILSVELQTPSLGSPMDDSIQPHEEFSGASASCQSTHGCI